MTYRKHSKHEAMAAHGERLKALFGLPAETNAIELYKQLHRIETRAHRRMEIQCSGPEHAIKTDAEMERFEYLIMQIVRRLLPNESVPIVINGDPRGYALKIDLSTGEQLHRDMGGYGIIAPDLTESD